MDTLLNADLLSVAITVAGIGLLGALIYFNKPSSVTARMFLGLALVTIVWSIANYFEYQNTGPMLGLFLIRSIVFLGTWHAYFFFRLCAAFPQDDHNPPSWYGAILLPATVVVSMLTLTPLVFLGVQQISVNGAVTAARTGPGMPIFVTFVGLLLLSGILTIGRHAIASSGVQRTQFITVVSGMIITFAAIIYFNLILPVFFDNAQYLPFSSVFIFPFIACIAFAIFRYQLMNIRIVTAEFFVTLLVIVTASQILFSHSLAELLFRAILFLFILGLAVLFVRSIISQEKQRDIIESQEHELENINKNQETLLHFISHEIKGYLTKGQSAFAGIIEGDYGDPTPQIADLARNSLAEMRSGVETIMDILDASNLRRGRISFEKLPFDFREAVEKVSRELRAVAEAKRLTFTVELPDTALKVLGDEAKARRHLIRNLIDNAIRYTPAGSIAVKLRAEGNHLMFSVADTGVGITPEDMTLLFTEGGHGRNSSKINVNSTGYGLYIAKQVAEAHGGTINAASDGEGKGATFTIELPTAVV